VAGLTAYYSAPGLLPSTATPAGPLKTSSITGTTATTTTACDHAHAATPLGTDAPDHGRAVQPAARDALDHAPAAAGPGAGPSLQAIVVEKFVGPSARLLKARFPTLRTITSWLRRDAAAGDPGALISRSRLADPGLRYLIRRPRRRLAASRAVYLFFYNKWFFGAL